MPGEQKHIYFLSVERMSWLSLFFFLRKVNAELEISIGILLDVSIKHCIFVNCARQM